MQRTTDGLLAAACLCFGLAQAASAADLAAKPPPVYKQPPASVMYNWMGVYVGVHAGGVWGNHEFDGRPAGSWLTFPAESIAFLAANESPTLRSSGFAGGAHIGFNYQSGAIVWGVEGDVSLLSSRKASNTGVLLDPFGTPTVFTHSAKVDWLVTVRPRLGLASDVWLMYATGGVAAGGIESTMGVLRPNSLYNSFGSASTTKVGWTAGGGLEYMFAPTWSLKAEYLYVDLGSVSYSAADSSGGFPTFFETASMRTTLHIVWIGLNRKFGDPASY